MITAFGKVLRKIRIDNGEILKNMADRLSVSSSYLSAIEVGKRSIPSDFIDRLTDIYHLSNNDVINLREAAQQSIKQIRLNLDGATAEKRNAALVFARRFDDLDSQTADKLLQILNKSADEG